MPSSRRPVKKRLINSSLERARRDGLPHALIEDDIKIPERCPVLGIVLRFDGTVREKGASPSLDRIVPHLGYVPGNVRVISHRANMLRNNATAEELEFVAADARTLCNNGIEFASSRSNMGAPKNRKSVALGANLRIGDDASFARVADALRKSGGMLDGDTGACKRLDVAHRTFMRWRQDIPKLETLVRTVRAEETAIKANAARAAEGESDDSGSKQESNDGSDGDGDAANASAAE